jgi:hypothetical protein
MTDFRFIQAAVAALLRDFPAELPDDVRQSLRANVDAGEPELTFDAVCSWLHELDVEIDPDYFSRLEEIRESLELPSDLLEYLRPQIASGD